MNPDQESLLALSSETGFRPATLEKVIRLGDLLTDVSRHPLLSRALVLKDGTAINLFLGEPRRLSVDLSERAWTAIERFLKPDDTEREFIDLVQQGELRPELLFGDDPDLADSVSRHPAILWKIENARTRFGR